MAVLVLPYIILCILVAIIGHNRPLRFWGYFLSSLLFSPLIGLLLLLAAGDNRAYYDDKRATRDS
jgi:hypothetical protein